VADFFEFLTRKRAQFTFLTGGSTWSDTAPRGFPAPPAVNPREVARKKRESLHNFHLNRLNRKAVPRIFSSWG
jgi:hypothetical protein